MSCGSQRGVMQLIHAMKIDEKILKITVTRYTKS